MDAVVKTEPDDATQAVKMRRKRIKTGVYEEEAWRSMEPEAGTIRVVPHSRLLGIGQVSMQLSPENSVDSTQSISVSHPPTIQVKSMDEGAVLNSPTNSCDEANSAAANLQADPASPEPGHYITVAGERLISTASESASDDVAHSYVQYIESTGEQTIYTASNGQMYPVYTVGDSGTMYTPTTGQYYSPGNTTPVTYTQVANTSASTQLIGNAAYLIQQGVETEHGIIAGARASPQTVSADVTYLVPGGTNGATSTVTGATSVVTGTTSALDDPGQPNIAHATRVSPTTVQWLLENYETAEGVSLPRSTLYNHYLRHCYDNKLDPVNAASFGKLIRSVFLGLRTRRLGTRGNSKYHYYGIRVKAGSLLTQISSNEEESSPRGVGNAKRFRLSSGPSSVSSGACKEEGQSGGSAPLQEYLGDGSGAIPDFPEVEVPTSPNCLPHMCTLDDLDTFRSIYREHCEAFLDAIVNLEFATIETLWREFWRSQEHSNGDECEEEKYLSKTKLYVLSKFKPIQEFVKRVDFLFYQNLVQVLIPDVLRPIPSSLTQAIRNFAKGLESWLSAAMQGCPTDMVDIKVSAVCAFAQTLRRYTSLNHLAQAARAVLQNSVQINQMLTDLNRVDFHNVQEQASWVCQCDASLVARLEADFKATLQQQNSLEQWAAWLKAVVATVLKPYQGRPNFTTAARQLLLKWSFYSSMVIRDLTLRSAASFGSFHLIRLLYDEYMFYLIEHQVALATGETPIAVMGEAGSSASSQTQEYEVGNGTNGSNNNVVDGQEILIDMHQVKRLKMS
ncbi:DNA-binding protein RFX2 isoform X2 [Cimex lectularius]|uniref:RFX-type winged-helix domain-containing protein n=1 Tax=Cimex lectularius TaxID=79782 RepID=A0A8I6TLD8_CIMLE|nr:DNA-binding protein RFX2 isoform X2 [Cimex lectularius]